jgi:hypothetical protein
MVDLAGFDVIGEIHIETVVDLLNLSPVTNPVDGKSIFLLGGPFSTDFSVPLGSLGTPTIRLTLSAELQPVIHQPLTRVVISFDGGTSLGTGLALANIRGQATVTVPAGFALPPSSPSPTGPQTPIFQFSAIAPDVVLDGSSRTAVDSTLGSGGADRLAAGLTSAIASLFTAAGTQALPAMAFSVVPGVDSHDPLQLSGVPTVAWIDGTTLGVFGYYRAAASGGTVSAKQSGDLGQANEEFFYGQPGLFSTVPGRRVALLLSAAAFRLVISCPAVRDQVVRGLVYKREHGKWVDWTRTQFGAQVAQQMNTRLVQYFMDELEQHPTDDLQQHFDKAKARIQKDIDAAIDAAATTRENAWLDSSTAAAPETSGGQQAITDAVPPPCGKGAVEIERKSVDHAQSDLVPMLRRLDVELAQGRISAQFAADGMLEVITGDVSFTVDGDVDIVVNVTNVGQIASSFTVQPPNIQVSASGLTGGILALLQFAFGPGTWRALMAFLSLVIQQKITDAIGTTFPHTLPVSLPQGLFPTRMAEIRIEPDSLFVAGLVCREPRWNDFNPALLVEAKSVALVPANTPSITGNLVFKETPWGCPAAEFQTTRTFWDETYSVRARLRDAPLPITVVGWQMELGNFSWLGIGTSHVLDPRPNWSNEPVAMVAGSSTLSGEVEHLDPLVRPYLRGPLVKADVPVDVTGDAQNGWQLSFRGVDGNFYVRFSADVVDGDGKNWHGETFVVHQGDHLEPSAGYNEYKADCDAKLWAWLHERFAALHLEETGRVLPGQPVMNGETREAVAIRTLIAAGDPAALTLLTEAGDTFGSGFYREVGQVAPLQLDIRRVENVAFRER